MKITDEKIIFNDKIVVEKAHISSDDGESFTRMRVNRQDASAVLLLNTDRNVFILTSQFRYAVVSKAMQKIIEIIAGKVDEGEEPLTAAIRETEEESGYTITSDNIKFLLTCFASPGYTSERLHLFFATVTDADKKAAGGGLETEHEHIELIEMDHYEFVTQLKAGLFEDAKTYLAGFAAHARGLYEW